MKKLSLLLFSTIAFFNLVSCDKKSKGTNCPAKQCEYGINPATCECNTNPNDTTTNPVDTGTIQPLKSKFGNGSNGTVDTTVNWAIGKDIYYWEDNDFLNFRSVFERVFYQALTYEVEINGQLKRNLSTLDGVKFKVNYDKNTDNKYRPTVLNLFFSIVDIDSSINTTVDVVNHIKIPFYALSETNPPGAVYLSNDTWNFGLGFCYIQGMFDSPNLYQEYNMKVQILSNTPTDRRFYIRVYIKHDNVKYVIKAAFKAIL